MSCGRRFQHRRGAAETESCGTGHCRRGRHLSSLKSGETCVVASDRLPQDLLRKLFPLGLGKGGVVEVLAGGIHNPFLIRTGETRIMLDWETVNRIPVKG